MVIVRRIYPFMPLLVLAALVFISGCDFVVQPLGGSEGRTQVYVAAGRAGAPNAGIMHAHRLRGNRPDAEPDDRAIAARSGDG